MTHADQKIISLNDLLNYDIHELISGEEHLKNILLQWIEIAHSLNLKKILTKYLNMVELHIVNLETFVEEEKKTSVFIKNNVIQYLISQTEEKMNSCQHTEIKDACLLAAIQSINHFKVFMYGTIASYATALGMEKSSAVFHAAKANERKIDDRLSEIAETEINVKAKIQVHERKSLVENKS